MGSEKQRFLTVKTEPEIKSNIELYLIIEALDKIISSACIHSTSVATLGNWFRDTVLLV